MAATIPSTGVPSPRVDAQPILVRSQQGIWSKAERIRDRLHDGLIAICKQEGVTALVLKSGPFMHPAWVKFECWIRHQDPLVTERSEVIIHIEPKAFHAHEFEYSLDVDDRGEKKKYAGLIRLDDELLRALVQYLLRRGPKPGFAAHQVRRYPWQLWRPRNKIATLKVDWLGWLPVILGMVGFLTLQFGIGLLILVGAAVTYYIARRRPVAVRSSGKPESEPRVLTRVDSWQAVVSGLGGDAELLRERFLKALESPPIKGLNHRVETIWYWGIDSRVERQQIVLSFQRCLLYCQIYSYDNELYVGWDGHLNTGQWVEKTLAKGFDRESSQLIKVNTVEPGTQQVTEYDVTDLSCVMEWTHAKLTQFVKELMEERKIDQEIDFKILRGERQKLSATRESEGTGKKTGGVLGRLRRTG